MTATSPAAVTRSTTARALRHVLFAGLLGVGALVAGGPFVVMALFGGVWSILLTLALVVAGVAGLAVVLDRAAGPGAIGREGSAERGVLLGATGSLTVAVLAWVVIQRDIGAELPVPLRIAPAALPFAVLAGLQWPGVVRRVTVLVLIATAAVIMISRWLDAAREERIAREDRAALLVTEVGTTARPWATDLDGFQAWVPEPSGSELIWSPYGPADGSGDQLFRLFRDDGSTVAPAGDPCALPSWWTPEGDQPTTSCRPIGEDRWPRTSDLWQQLLERRDDEWVGVTALRDVPETLLAEAMANARRMTDEEYDLWAQAMLPQDRTPS